MRLFLLAALLLIGCGSSTNENHGDGGSGSPDSGPVAHPLCPRPDARTATQFSEEIGKSCGMGSNLGLCASSGASSCPETGVCLWHADAPDGKRAYCTITCDPTAADSCPPRFACQTQGCSMGPPNVCVRVAAEPEPTCQGTTELLPDRGLSVYAVARAGERLYVVGKVSTPDPGTVVLTRQVDSSGWQLIHDGPYLGIFDWEVLSAGQTVLFQSFGYGSKQTLLRAAGTTVTEEQLPACDGDPNKCVRQLELLFDTADGAVRAIGRDNAGLDYLLRRDAGGIWNVVRPLEYKLLYPQRLDRGLVAACRGASEPYDAVLSLCVSRDGQTVQTVPLPTGHQAEGQLNPLGASPDDFYIFFRDVLAHRVQGQWLADSVPVDEGAQLKRAADGSLYLRSKQTLYRLDGGCWRQLPDMPGLYGLNGLVPLTGRSFLQNHSLQLCIVQLD